MRPTSKSEAAGPISTAPSTKRERPSFSCCAPNGAIAAAKAFFRRAFRGQGRLPHKITLDGYQASHRAAKEALGEHSAGNQCEVRSSKYVNNLIEQDHRSIKLRLAPMLGLKHFRRAATTIAGIELMHRIRKGQFRLREASRSRQNRSRDLESRSCYMIRGDFQASAWLDLQRLHQSHFLHTIEKDHDMFEAIFVGVLTP